MRKDMRH